MYSGKQWRHRPKSKETLRNRALIPVVKIRRERERLSEEKDREERGKE
jgi:hypothetical protein